MRASWRPVSWPHPPPAPPSPLRLDLRQVRPPRPPTLPRPHPRQQPLPLPHLLMAPPAALRPPLPPPPLPPPLPPPPSRRRRLRSAPPGWQVCRPSSTSIACPEEAVSYTALQARAQPRASPSAGARPHSTPPDDGGTPRIRLGAPWRGSAARTAPNLRPCRRRGRLRSRKRGGRGTRTRPSRGAALCAP